MKKKSKNYKNTVPLNQLTHFKWGGSTSQWEEEADQIMNTLQDNLDDAENSAEKRMKIQYGKQKQH